MKQLRKRPRIDSLGTQQRAGSVRWGRLVYLVLVTAFAGSLVYYLAGSMVVLSLDGTVLRDRSAVDAAYPAKVIEVFVREGQTVEAGVPLVRLESFDMVKQLADFAYRDGELALRVKQIEGRMASIDSLLPLAERIARESRLMVERFDTVDGKGLVSAVTKNTALRGSFDTADKLSELTIQKQTTKAELAVVSEAYRSSQSAVVQLTRIYDEGYVRAPAAGIVGAKVPLLGQVVDSGDQLMQINGGRAHLLAYLPDQYLFSIREGMTVNVSGGGHTVRGRLESILAVADALPAEFQNMFRPRDRSRLVRIALPEDQPFAASQKVQVTGCAFGFCWAGR
jgi:multidrug resistance efflux pump